MTHGTSGNANPDRPSTEARIRSGATKGRAVWLVFKLLLVGGAVLMFAFDDTPMRPYLITTAIVMGGILIAWPWLQSKLN